MIPMNYVEALPDVAEFDEEKFVELVLYVSDQCAADEDFGAVKLNKILHAADFQAYARYGTPITGAEYFHLPQGPAPRLMKPISDRLQDGGDIAIHERGRYGRLQKRTVPLREPDLRHFQGWEIALVDNVIAAFEGKNATDVSNISHENDTSIGWQLARDRETIPYQTVFVSALPPSRDDLEWARELAEEYGWLEA